MGHISVVVRRVITKRGKDLSMNHIRTVAISSNSCENLFFCFFFLLLLLNQSHLGSMKSNASGFLYFVPGQNEHFLYSTNDATFFSFNSHLCRTNVFLNYFPQISSCSSINRFFISLSFIKFASTAGFFKSSTLLIT